jgi:hypothetical protein
MKTRLIAMTCAVALVGAACGDDDALTELSTPLQCNPLGGQGCITPWPSSLYQIDDPSTATGRRLDVPVGAFPANIDGVAFDPSWVNERDGFSPASFVFTAFPGGIDPAGLVGADEIEASLAPDSATVIVDMQTGERVAHFAELDVNAAGDLDNQALYLRPATRLVPGHRYAVAIRASLKAPGGGALPVPEGFAALRDGAETNHARLEAVRDRYPAIFQALEAVGVPRDELIVAWDFTTGSDEQITAKLLAARDAALSNMGPIGANVTFAISADAPIGDGTRIVRRVEGEFNAPMLLTENSPDGRLALDEAGEASVTGTIKAKFSALVPACATAESPAQLVIYGHGFFGNITAATADYAQTIADENCAIVVGTEWTGMSQSDIPGAALALNDVNRIPNFTERIIQGIVNFITLGNIARGSMASQVFVDSAGAMIADPSRISFYGISQGAILGTTLLAYDPSITRGVLAVGGGNWSLLFERSTNWPQYYTILAGSYPEPIHIPVLLSLLQLGYDFTDNIHVANRILDDPLPGASQKRLLLQMAVDDSQVTNLASFLQARELGVPVLSPSVLVPYRLTEAAAPQSSALVIFDEKPSPPPPADNRRHEIDNGTHTNVRWRAAARAQIEAFLATGEIAATCKGACDCAAGACD